MRKRCESKATKLTNKPKTTYHSCNKKQIICTRLSRITPSLPYGLFFSG
jgi:hypothetical protein